MSASSRRLPSIKMALFIAVAVMTTSCANVRERAKDTWLEELDAERFSAFSPPREGQELGNVITFDDKGREYLIASVATCLPSLQAPMPRAVALLSTSSDATTSQGLSGSVAEALRGKVDLSFAAKNSSMTKVSLRLGSPKITQYEILLLKSALGKLERGSDCYKAVANPRNLIVVSTLSVSSITYEFKDSADRELKLTADIAAQAKLSPSLAQKFDGQASLVVEQPLLIGYRAIAVRELPGLNADSFEVRELSPGELEKMRAKIRK